MGEEMRVLTFEELKDKVSGGAVAIRARQTLQPAGGRGEKVFPPTYFTGEKALKYATESRRIDGREARCVLLDSVASQANRMEEALLSAWERKEIDFPVIGVDFSSDPELADLGVVTSLEAPHRIADAILRDATDLEGTTLFRNTPEGRAFTEASARNATAVYSLCPTALVFGVWDSTSLKGGMGAKFQRALTSEIVAVDALWGVKVGSRIDPVGIQANVPVYHHKDDDSDWTIDPSEARHENKKPVLFGRKKEGKGKPSAINHSNVAPTIDVSAGGVTFDHAVQTVVLSLPALRKLRFATDLGGRSLENREAVEQAARVSLAALALCAIVHQRAQGHDLRSRCLLVAEGPLRLEILDGDGQIEEVRLSVEQANQLLGQANAEASKLGLGFEREPLRLRPAPKLVALIKKSRSEAAAGTGDEGA